MPASLFTEFPVKRTYVPAEQATAKPIEKIEADQLIAATNERLAALQVPQPPVAAMPVHDQFIKGNFFNIHQAIENKFLVASASKTINSIVGNYWGWVRDGSVNWVAAGETLLGSKSCVHDAMNTNGIGTQETVTSPKLWTAIPARATPLGYTVQSMLTGSGTPANLRDQFGEQANEPWQLLTTTWLSYFSNAPPGSFTSFSKSGGGFFGATPSAAYALAKASFAAAPFLANAASTPRFDSYMERVSATSYFAQITALKTTFHVNTALLPLPIIAAKFIGVVSATADPSTLTALQFVFPLGSAKILETGDVMPVATSLPTDITFGDASTLTTWGGTVDFTVVDASGYDADTIRPPDPTIDGQQFYGGWANGMFDFYLPAHLVGTGATVDTGINLAVKPTFLYY